jgi:hypothetical protein
MGSARDALKVFLQETSKTTCPERTGSIFIPDAIQGANAVLGLGQAGSLSGLFDRVREELHFE